MFPECSFLLDGLSNKLNNFAKGRDKYKSKNITIEKIKKFKIDINLIAKSKACCIFICLLKIFIK